MDADTFQEIASTIALFIVAPYVIGPPVAIVWCGLAFAVERLTGWRGMLPADCWQ